MGAIQQYIDTNGIYTREADSPDLDAFGRKRISNPYPLFSANHLFNKQAAFFQELTASGGSATHLPNESTVRMDVTTTVGSRVVRQQKYYNPYQPGFGFLVLCTGVLSTTTGVRSRIGLFDDVNDKSVGETSGNGCFFQSLSGVVSVNLRSYITGSQVDATTNQSSWNLDKLDGTGLTGITLDFTKAQIFIIDLQWLGVGRVRFGFNIGGKIIYCHEINNANSLTSVYMTRAALPVRFEIEQITGASASSMKMVCGSVISEGGFNPSGKVFARGTSALKSVSNGVETPVIAIRAKTTFNRVPIKLLRMTFANTANQTCIINVYVGNAISFTGASFTSANADSAVEFDVSATAATIPASTYQIDGFYSSAAIKELIIPIEDLSTILAGSSINGTPDIILVTCNPTGNSTVHMGLKWQELY